MAVAVENVNAAWNFITGALSPQNVPNQPASREQLCVAADILRNHGMGEVIQEYFLEILKQDIRQNVSPRFWKSYDTSTTDVNTLYNSIGELYKYLSTYFPCFERLDLICQHLGAQEERLLQPESVRQTAQRVFKAVIFFCPPKCFHEAVHKAYSQAVKIYNHRNQQNGEDKEEEEESLKCQGCNELLESCQCDSIMGKFQTFNKQLDELGLLEYISGGSVTSITNEDFKLYIEHTCKGNFETSYVAFLENWLDVTVLGWLTLIYGGKDISSLKARLQHYLYDTYGRARIEQLFNIIVDFPESRPALDDLKVCLQKTDLRGHLVKELKTAFENRLLHPGVNTTDILTAYISSIRALRVLDPTGVLLELVCEPVRKYLRSRDDTVRCIVASLTEEGSNELSEELFKGNTLVLDETCQSDEEDEDWENWMPDPVDADPAKTSKSRRTSDIISMLVNIYGSKELFVNEYRTLLADRILSQFSYDTEREIRYLELLKLRFGESQLHYCEVMLKDVADSKRINSHIAEQKEREEAQGVEREDAEEIPVNSMVLSAQFWPSFREEKIELPEIMQTSLKTYTKSFEALKGNRTLQWKPHLGLMDIEIELKNSKTLNMKVTPVQAAIFMQFQEKEKWTVDELSTVLKMPSAALRRKITFWQTKGLLKEEVTDTFVLVEEHKARHNDIMVVDEDEAESAMASSHDQREEEMQVYWSYIVGMLTNLESLPLERIHTMLKMFAMQGPTTSECCVQELKTFLDRKVKEQKLLYSGGVYRLPKGGS
ncbi:anaphase-promoting complex subunit 2-like [Lingula anatina]|uniref:Anaphase-promoting complex subunit 2 n=1 Tax=Lingula anatina TaxID=7574 RepID=A0A1S3KB87_LINAN|nr:anaphase-promoting complex subunit 2-like [Lingula anatina]|eukprot:XP_013419521.1 anaphase-promoting complex subunit 2-like [Lingula anatina]